MIKSRSEPKRRRNTPLFDGAAGFDGDRKIGPGVIDNSPEARGGEDDVSALQRIAPG